MADSFPRLGPDVNSHPLRFPVIRPMLIDARKRVLRTYRRWRRPKVIRHAGVLLELDRRIPPEIMEYLYSGEYERSELKALRRHLRPDDVVMELGAGIGFISLACAKRIGAARVFSFEANPALEPLILRNYELNQLSPTLEIGVLGEGNGETDFYVHDHYWLSSTQPGVPNTRHIRVPARPLNDKIRQIDPTFLIMDIEGGERELCRFIDLHNIRKVAMELHTELIGRDEAEAIPRRLRDAGFTVGPDPIQTPTHQLFAWRD
jgi:FkbM family methyltransferase